MSQSTFADLAAKAWPHQFTATLDLTNIVGGVPSDPKVAEGWIRSKIQTTDDRIRQMVGETMIDRGVTGDQAVAEVAATSVNGFKRDDQGLYIEGRQVKAAIKEAASVAMAGGFLTARGWGNTNKGLLGYIAEHVMVVEDRIYVGKSEADGILQRFVSTFRGQGISYDEYVENVTVTFTVLSDHDFTREQWGHIWLKGEQQGLGACRSQGYGRYVVTSWEEAKQSKRRTLRATG